MSFWGELKRRNVYKVGVAYAIVDGLSEETLNSLAQIPDLTVIARTSSFSFKGKDKTIQEIASVLGVENVLEGSVRKAGNALRITAQLVLTKY